MIVSFVKIWQRVISAMKGNRPKGHFEVENSMITFACSLEIIHWY